MCHQGSPMIGYRTNPLAPIGDLLKQRHTLCKQRQSFAKLSLDCENLPDHVGRNSQQLFVPNLTSDRQHLLIVTDGFAWLITVKINASHPVMYACKSMLISTWLTIGSRECLEERFRFPQTFQIFLRDISDKRHTCNLGECVNPNAHPLFIFGKMGQCFKRLAIIIACLDMGI